LKPFIDNEPATKPLALMKLLMKANLPKNSTAAEALQLLTAPAATVLD
jgi:muramidase (phage lysozyme)